MATTSATIPFTFTIEPFDPAVTPWTRWLKRLEGAFTIFKVPAENKVPYLLHYLGPTAYNVLADRLAPQDPYEKTYDEIAQRLQDFYEPKPLEVAENFKLMQRKQQEGETVQDFLTALQKLSLNCKLGEYTKIALRNYFIYGLRNKRIQNRLLEIPDLDLERAVQMATTMELSEKGTKQLQGEETIASVGLITKKTSFYKDKSSHTKKFERGKSQRNGAKDNNEHTDRRDSQREKHEIICFRCGRNHYASACTIDRSIKCLRCGKTGHLRKVFKSNTFSTNTVNLKNTSNKILAVEHVQFRDKIYVTLNVNDKRVRFEIDSGAAVTLISKSDAKKLFPGERIFKTKIRINCILQNANSY